MPDGARILHGGDWYHRLAPTALYESHFEEVLVESASLLCPGFAVVPFKETVESPEGNARADLALVERSYRCWYVVEVELGIHSREHVESQVRKLSGGRYEERHANALHRKRAQLQIDDLRSMMKGEQPRVIVMVNEEYPKWRDWLRPYDAILVSIEMYRSVKNTPMLRLIGDLPEVEPLEKVTDCDLDGSTSLLRIASPAALLGATNGATIQIVYGDDLLEWTLLTTKTDVYLVPKRKNPLQSGRTYQIVRKGESLEIMQTR